MKSNEIIVELKDFLMREKISFEEASNLRDKYKYIPLKKYIDNMLAKVKPETATKELFVEILQDVLKVESKTEVALDKGGFIDVRIEQKKGNPVLFELKKSYNRNEKRNGLNGEKISLVNMKEQIQKYLQSHNFVLLTNLKETYFFNQTALYEFKEFDRMDFIDFLDGAIERPTIWDFVSRAEDSLPLSDLDREFFENLKKWHKEFETVDIEESPIISEKKLLKMPKEELIVLFLNKIIFIRTLEDYGLIPYKKYLQEKYFESIDEWEPKGIEKIFDNFFEWIERWFYTYYNTELFSTNFWSYVKKEKKNLKCLKRVFENVLGFGDWNMTFGKGLIHYNYRQIDEDIFGKAYESFIAENRKDGGIYYTPKSITIYMSNIIVEELFKPIMDNVISLIDNEKYEEAYKEYQKTKQIKIIDPTSGSGSFLIKVIRNIFDYYKKIDKRTEWVKPENFVHNTDNMHANIPPTVRKVRDFRKKIGLNNMRILISQIILNHIFAADIDERALETAKTNIWKEAIKLQPNIFESTNQNEDEDHILPNLTMNFIQGDSLLDIPITQQIEIIQNKFKDNIIQLHTIRNDYIANPYNTKLLNKIYELKNTVYQELKKEIPNNLLTNGKPLFYALEFFFCYFDTEGNPLEAQGFDGLISNPPWEIIKAVRKEFAKQNKYEMDVTEFTKWWENELATNNGFKERWVKYKTFYQNYSDYIKERFILHGPGDFDYYKIFMERDIQLIKPQHNICILIPESFHIAKGSIELRREIFDKYTLLDLLSFENRGYNITENGKKVYLKFFPKVDERDKFSIVHIQTKPSPENHCFNAKFYMQHPDELYTEHIQYSLDMIKEFSPENLSIMEFRTLDDYALCGKIMDGHKTVKDLGFVMHTEFHMTNDNDLFIQKPNKKALLLYKGEMIYHYEHKYAGYNYMINEVDGRKRLMSKELYRIHKLDKNFTAADFKKNKFKLDYESFRLVYRAIASSTNERTLISTIVPSKVFLGNSIIYFMNYSYELQKNKIVQKQMDCKDLLYIMALFNSLTLDYFIRLKVTKNVSMFFIYEMPIAEPTDEQTDFIVKRAFSLMYHSDFDDLKKQLGIEIETGDKIKMRAELEVMIARDLYGIDAKEWGHLCSTFIYGKNATKVELDAIIAESKKMF